MNRAATRRLARAIISPSAAIADERLDACLDIAAALFHSLAGPITEIAATITGQTPYMTDETGKHTIATITQPNAIAALATPGAQLIVADTAPRWRIVSLTQTQATVAIYTPDGEPIQPGSLRIRTAARDIWPPTADAAVAMLAASYYTQADALAEPDPRRAETLADISATLYGRATQLLRS